MKNIFLCAVFLVTFYSSCTKTKEEPKDDTPSTVVNGTATLVLDGKSYTLDCFANRNANPDGCGKIDLILYQSGQPSITFYHFPENASGTFTVGDGNSQRACNQIYAYVTGGYFSQAITLTKTADKSFKYTGTIYEPVTRATKTVYGEGSYKN